MCVCRFNGQNRGPNLPTHLENNSFHGELRHNFQNGGEHPLGYCNLTVKHFVASKKGTRAYKADTKCQTENKQNGQQPRKLLSTAWKVVFY